MTLENENNQAESGDYKGEERRQTFRYLFEKRDALKIRFKQKEIHLLEISAGGLRFVNQGFQKLETGSITVTLKIPGHKNNTT
ncbi:MAG: hypothetical protein GY729_12070, partial [Desulfobacteraceae bacterium]|nr:hypothetical protein [Desulfobacteraceae bacterium]